MGERHSCPGTPILTTIAHLRVLRKRPQPLHWLPRMGKLHELHVHHICMCGDCFLSLPPSHTLCLFPSPTLPTSFPSTVDPLPHPHLFLILCPLHTSQGSTICGDHHSFDFFFFLSYFILEYTPDLSFERITWSYRINSDSGTAGSQELPSQAPFYEPIEREKESTIRLPGHVLFFQRTSQHQPVQQGTSYYHYNCFDHNYTKGCISKYTRG